IVNGTLSPGNGIGAFNTGAESWNGGGSYVVEMNDALATAGADPGWDLLNISGPLTVAATSANKFSIKLISRNGASVGSTSNFDRTENHSWRIATASGGVSGFGPDKFNVDASGFQNYKGPNGAFSITQSGN